MIFILSYNINLIVLLFSYEYQSFFVLKCEFYILDSERNNDCIPFLQ